MYSSGTYQVLDTQIRVDNRLQLHGTNESPHWSDTNICLRVTSLSVPWIPYLSVQVFLTLLSPGLVPQVPYSSVPGHITYLSPNTLPICPHEPYLSVPKYLTYLSACRCWLLRAFGTNRRNLPSSPPGYRGPAMKRTEVDDIGLLTTEHSSHSPR